MLSPEAGSLQKATELPEKAWKTCTGAIHFVPVPVWVRFPTAESANPILFLFMPGTALRVYSILRAQEAQEVKKLPKASQALPGS